MSTTIRLSDEYLDKSELRLAADLEGIEAEGSMECEDFAGLVSLALELLEEVRRAYAQIEELKIRTLGGA